MKTTLYNMKLSKILVISLGRKAMEEHTKNMLQTIHPSLYTLLHSKYSETKYNVDCEKIIIKTYTSKVTFLVNSIFILPNLLFKLCKNLHKYDIYFFPVNHPWNFPIILLLKLLKKITILTIHDAEMHPGEENKIVELSSKYAMKTTDYLVFLSNHVQQTAYKKYNLNKPFRIISQGLFPLPNLEFKAGLNGKRILFLGRISKYKGVDLLVEAINELKPDAYESLTIAGMPIYMPNIPSNNSKIILRADYLSDEEISNFLNNADIVVLPYIEASQSGIVLLATQAEKPMICTRVGGLTEQLTEQECVFINPSKEELKHAIVKLLNDKELYNSIQKELAEKKKRLSWKTKSEELLNFVNEIRENRV